MEGSKKYLSGRRKKEYARRVFAASEEVSEQHVFLLYKWGRSKEYYSTSRPGYLGNCPGSGSATSLRTKQGKNWSFQTCWTVMLLEKSMLISKKNGIFFKGQLAKPLREGLCGSMPSMIHWLTCWQGRLTWETSMKRSRKTLSTMLAKLPESLSQFEPFGLILD